MDADVDVPDFSGLFSRKGAASKAPGADRRDGKSGAGTTGKKDKQKNKVQGNKRKAELSGAKQPSSTPTPRGGQSPATGKTAKKQKLGEGGKQHKASPGTAAQQLPAQRKPEQRQGKGRPQPAAPKAPTAGSQQRPQKPNQNAYPGGGGAPGGKPEEGRQSGLQGQPKHQPKHQPNAVAAREQAPAKQGPKPHKAPKARRDEHGAAPGGAKSGAGVKPGKRKAAEAEEDDGDERPGPSGRGGPAPAPGGGKADGSKKRRKVDTSFWPFEVDYNDHFETPIQAVRDLQPVLTALCGRLGKSPAQLAVYDPFFCQGGIRRHFEALGYTNFIHRKRDFYADVEAGNLPKYDVLVTNPPYSEDHKERILEFCLRSGKPWALLMPNYVATKAYFAELLDATSTPAPQRPFFLTPHTRYEYEHPEGTGHAESPFFSIWYVGLGPHTEPVFQACRARTGTGTGPGAAAAAGGSGGGGKGVGGGKGAAGAGAGPWGVDLARGVEHLKAAGAVPTARRPNPRQRRKIKEQMAARAQRRQG
ncbi:hypothetical protein HYH03_011186 [Edaphochlamys debaryana]|uniref:Uncharacterized protein n=1 Tax=Edaphochlamys debaryana TaxID=47281 RepID=A0A835Y0N0_9CHLO|nr:hypothetical protein HYH03_011186 [Edaphochlamys debaryana]|eukprot:KAG2490385.1 hypothetical protein HYH03_011186 [Edaphochlamys debaryana]